jgi:hypothetical protein
MNILPFALLAGALLVNHPGLAQTAPEPSSSPAAPAAPGADAGPGETSPAAGGMAASPTPAPEQTPTRQITVASLTNKNLKGQDDRSLGGIARVVESTADNQTFVVVRSGGLLGFFEKQYLIPVEQIAVTDDGDSVVAKELTQAELENATPFVEDPVIYQPLEDTRLVSIAERR